MEPSLFRHAGEVSEDQAGKRLDSFLLGFPFTDFDNRLDPSRTTLQKWIDEGCVRVNDEVRADKSYRVRTGDIVSIEVPIRPDIMVPPPEPLDIGIVFQDPYIIVIDKPAGISSHPVSHAMTGSVVNFLYYKKVPLPPTSHPLRPGIVHRLDKNTTGLMVVACTDTAVSRLIEMIKRREVERTYIAIVWGNPPLNSGTIDAPIARCQKDRRKMAVTRGASGKPALTYYRVLARYPTFSFVACKLDTGRTHQIRVHMSYIGYPVAGDPVYGGRRAQDKISTALASVQKYDPQLKSTERTLRRIAAILTRDNVHLLHAAMLRFDHPITGEKLSFRVEPHGKFNEVLGLLNTLPHEETAVAL